MGHRVGSRQMRDTQEPLVFVRAVSRDVSRPIARPAPAPPTIIPIPPSFLPSATNLRPKESTAQEFQPNEPPMPKPRGPLIHSQGLTSSSFRSVPKANRLLNSLSITWRAWSPRTQRRRDGRGRVSDLSARLLLFPRGPRAEMGLSVHLTHEPRCCSFRQTSVSS